MPLDPNIFFQGAALRQANDARLQQQIGSIFDRLAAARLKQQEIESDPKRKLQAAAERMVSGQGTPEDEIFLKAASALEGPKMQMTSDPVTGAAHFVQGPSLIDSLMAASGKQYRPQYNPVGQVGQADFTGMDIPAVDLNQPAPQGPIPPPMKPQGNNLVENLMKQDIFQTPQIAGEGRYAGSPNQMRAVGEANVALRQKSGEADISASQKGAETYESETAKIAAAKQSKADALGNFIAQLESFGEENVSKLPGGLVGSIAAKATNLANVPSESAKAQARFETNFPILIAEAKNFVRTAGEGTFTDADRKAIEKMVWNDSDALEVKKEKYNELLRIMKNSRSNITGQKEQYIGSQRGKPGWSIVRRK